MTPTKEQLEARREWVAALRSGKYKQTNAYLNRVIADGNLPVGMCCLGVACDVFGPRNNLQWTPSTDGTILIMGSRMSVLPDGIAAVLGIGPNGDLMEMVGVHTYLWSLNDSRNYTFAQIAQVIEDQFIAPFEDVTP